MMEPFSSKETLDDMVIRMTTYLSESSNVYADVASRWDCQNHYGYDKWFAGHRNGASGLANPYTQDIQSKFSNRRLQL